MISLFIGLNTANILLLTCTFGLGLFATGQGAQPTQVFTLHITLGIAAGLMCTLTHVATYTYFMATTKWLGAATNKANLDPTQFVTPTLARKHRALWITLSVIALTLLAMFAGAAVDPTMPNRPLPPVAHLIMGIVALAANLVGAIAQFSLVYAQTHLIDDALDILNHPAAIEIGQA